MTMVPTATLLRFHGSTHPELIIIMVGKTTYPVCGIKGVL
jgi:hypothetical protein